MKLGITWGQRLGLPECPYLRRWVLNLHFCTFRIHHFVRSDDRRNFHDHPWWFLTIILKGGYTDINPQGEQHLTAGCFAFRRAKHQHTVAVDPGGVWTLVITGRQKRRWGFWVNGKFKKSNKYFLEHGHHACDQL